MTLDKSQMYTQAIVSDKQNKKAFRDIARKVYVSYPTFAFLERPELEFEILDRVATRFNVPISVILVAGSAHTGVSYVKRHPFCAGQSDLDLAIIDPCLFSQHLEEACVTTSGYRDLTRFQPLRDGSPSDGAFMENISKGFFRPDLMPRCNLKNSWFDFFRKLSDKYRTEFGSINAGIYMAHSFFEHARTADISAVSV